MSQAWVRWEDSPHTSIGRDVAEAGESGRVFLGGLAGQERGGGGAIGAKGDDEAIPETGTGKKSRLVMMTGQR